MNPSENSVPTRPFFPSGRKETVFGLLMLLFCVFLANSWLIGNGSLGFALGSCAVLALSAGYLLTQGFRLRFYTGALLVLSLVILAGFGRSDDSFVKFVLFLFVLTSGNLALCLLAGQNRRNPGRLASLLDGPRALLVLGMGKMDPAFRGLRRHHTGQGFRRSGSVALGLLLALPLAAVLLLLLNSADAAFAGMLSRLPHVHFGQLMISLILGGVLAAVLYTRGSALAHAPKEAPVVSRSKAGLSPLTVNTVLLAVCGIFLVYLFSQLAYFVGGFSGLLPEGFTVAEYARRGFFEIAWICAINLGVIALASRFSKGLTTRLCCLFIGLFSLFLVATAAAKMVLYIRSFALSRLRVLTMVILLWLAVTLVLVCLRMFVRKLAYMKGIVLTALALGAAVLWVDVDTQVARYNVSAYQSGKLETVDVSYLSRLSDGAVPEIARLLEDTDPDVAEEAWLTLLTRYSQRIEDFRGWNYASARAESVLTPIQSTVTYFRQSEDSPRKNLSQEDILWLAKLLNAKTWGPLAEEPEAELLLYSPSLRRLRYNSGTGLIWDPETGSACALTEEENTQFQALLVTYGIRIHTAAPAGNAR